MFFKETRPRPRRPKRAWTRRAVASVTRIWPRVARSPRRAARLVTTPVAVYVQAGHRRHDDRSQRKRADREPEEEEAMRDANLPDTRIALDRNGVQQHRPRVSSADEFGPEEDRDGGDQSSQDRANRKVDPHVHRQRRRPRAKLGQDEDIHQHPAQERKRGESQATFSAIVAGTSTVRPGGWLAPMG